METINVLTKDGSILGWSHISDSGVKTGTMLRYFIRDMSLTYEDEMAIVESQVSKFMGLAESEYEITTTERKW